MKCNICGRDIAVGYRFIFLCDGKVIKPILCEICARQFDQSIALEVVKEE